MINISVDLFTYPKCHIRELRNVVELTRSRVIFDKTKVIQLQNIQFLILSSQNDYFTTFRCTTGIFYC